MRNIAIAATVILIITILVLVLASFQVREIESALVTTFGKPTREITKPGWYFKWPFPIQRVYKFDARMRAFEADPGETTTKGAVPIIVKTYVVWNIAEPLNFFNAVGTIAKAENKLLSQIFDTQSKVVGRHLFGEFVNSDPTRIRFKDIEKEMLDELQQAIAGASYGMEIRTLGIKQLKISEDVSKDVFERMRAERERRTKATIAEGNAQATKIISDADAKKRELLAAAEARAKAIRAQGDADAAKWYEMLEEEPELAMFLRNTEALRKMLKERAMVVLPADAEPFDLLKKMPDIELKESKAAKEMVRSGSQ
jgi:membrane protease subunit HflC